MLDCHCHFYCQERLDVVGIDIDKKSEHLSSNKSYLERIGNDKFNKFNKKNIFCSDFSKVKDSDFIIICVPTPLKKNNTRLKFY